ncbi:hypothetical protein QQZ08_005313 [Neonectria magnoliae]|uniref:NACHT domain-containing protein n=1 Tax=Neonectria magnoliae TaxID=2732573 RepID=A0ABR1I3Y4_9HYPO
MSDPQKYAVGWVCAIATEYHAAQLFLDEEHEAPESVSVNDSNNYTLGKIGKHHVVIAVLLFPNVRISLMVGIGGGAPSSKHDIRLEDVVVSASSNGTAAVFQYDFGKAVQGQAFQEMGLLNQPPTVLRAAVNGLLTQYKRKGHQLDGSIADILTKNPRLKKEFQRPEPSTDRLYQPGKVHPLVRPDRTEYEDDPAIHHGSIASSNRLMKDALTRDALVAKKCVLCFEMEAAGLMNHFPCLVIRGICDYSDSHKNKEWQGFAAMMAAAIEAERPIGEVLNSVQGRLDRVLSTANETRDAIVTITSDSHLARVERWLSPPDYSTDAKLARKRRHAGTGTWHLDSPVFQEWKLGSRRHLWLYGLAGGGKTVLSTKILDNLLQTDTRTTLAFFFDFNDPGKQTLESLLRSLAFQLYRSGGEAVRALDSLFNYHDNGRRQPDTSALSACVNTMIQITGKVTVILDALDECTTREELLPWMRGFASSNAQLLVTGRPEADFQREIPRFFDERNCVLLDKRAVNADIRSYVMATLEQNPNFRDKKLSPGLLEKIRDKVGDGADGILAKCLSPHDIKTALESLPRDLDETYSRMLQSIPLTYKSGAIRLLQFLVYAKRPLKLSEAIEVIATQIDREPRRFHVENRLFCEADVLRYCPSLVSIAEATEYRETQKELHLAHFSVKEYLLKEDQFDLGSASITITRTCLTYLADINSSHNTIKRDFPMARYAAESWMDYAASAQTSEDIRWGRLYQADKAWNKNPELPRASALYYACLGGLARAVRDLMNEGADVNVQGGRFSNALQAASFGGHLEVVQLLLDKGANITVANNNGWTPVNNAAANGHLEVAKLLVDKGADIMVADNNGWTPLLISSKRGHAAIVRLLQLHQVNPNSTSKSERTPLSWASQKNNEAVIQVLLEAEGVDINSRDDSGRTPLMWAARAIDVAALRLLCKGGVNIDIEDSCGLTALQLATMSFNMAAEYVLLECV